jgi:hypothetical protein
MKIGIEAPSFVQAELGRSLLRLRGLPGLPGTFCVLRDW